MYSVACISPWATVLGLGSLTAACQVRNDGSSRVKESAEVEICSGVAGEIDSNATARAVVIDPKMSIKKRKNPAVRILVARG